MPTATRQQGGMAKRSAAMLLLIASIMSAPAVRAGRPSSEAVLSAETQRIEVINRVAPSVVCVFDSRQSGGGSGVLIDPHGYGLTNFHVVAGLLNTRRGWGGLSDGVLYELEVLGVDLTGDLAMFRLIPPDEDKVGTGDQKDATSRPDGRRDEGAERLGEGGKSPPYRFPYARLGDSDAVRVGDTVIAMGNPFTLSEDYTPGVTLGIVTGIHRYQWGSRGNLVYTDCIQVDAPINPGSSGGPLFNAAGEIVGINGRISVNTRGRFNVGFGYAISSNQIKRFIPALRAGLLARHGAWQATVQTVEGTGVVFSEVRQPGPAYDAGVRIGDKLISFDGVRTQTANQVASILGTYPADWPVLLRIEHAGTPRDVIVRLQPIEPRLDAPFEVDRDVNLRQVKRVLEAFRRAALGDEATEPPSGWKWTIHRRHGLAADGPAGVPAGARIPAAGARIPSRTRTSPERFDVTLAGDGPVRMQRRYQDGSAGRLIEYDDKKATQRVTAEGESYGLAADTRMILVAIYTMQRWLLGPVDQMDLTRLRRVAHAGGDALVPPSVLNRSAPAAGRVGENRLPGVGETHLPGWVAHPPGWVSPTLLEVIEWPMADHTVARFAFDSESFAIVRVEVRDLLSGTRATIKLSDHRDIGGLIWPCTIEVEGSSYGYRDTLSDWELSW